VGGTVIVGGSVVMAVVVVGAIVLMVEEADVVRFGEEAP
jgi:hypothetical protein